LYEVKLYKKEGKIKFCTENTRGIPQEKNQNGLAINAAMKP
jgi:hypothetical protein